MLSVIATPPVVSTLRSTLRPQHRPAVPVVKFQRRSKLLSRAAGPRSMAATRSQIVVDNAPSEEKLKELGVRRWPTWGCEASSFPWSYDSAETCYVLEGHVFVTPDGGEAVEIRAGDMATFPAGMSCTWDVKKAIHKHYKFH